MIVPNAVIWSSAGTFRQGTADKLAFILLNQLDLAMTVLAMSLGFNEINPVMRQMLTVPVLLIIFKTALPILIAWLSPGKFLRPAIILLCLVTGWNLKELIAYLL